VREIPPAIVPDVTNRPVADALALIDKAGLRRGDVDDRPAPGPPGIVLAQSLKPGTEVPRGTLLHLGVSQVRETPPAPEVPPAIVPDVTNRPVAEALALIDKAGLARGTVRPRTAVGPTGVVLDQSLTPGAEVARGTPLHLGVSQAGAVVTPPGPSAPGPPAVTGAPGPPAPTRLLVPAVTGRDVVEARAAVRDAGLTVGSITERSFFLPPFLQPARTVFEQQPPAGTSLAVPAPVNLIILQSVPTWAIVLPLTLLGAAAGFMVRRPTADALRGPRLPAPGVRTRIYADRGAQRVTSASDPVTMEIRVRPVIDRGAQSVDDTPPSSGGAAVDSPHRHT
jgi:serine/threonine-protein kinase